MLLSPGILTRHLSIAVTKSSYQNYGTSVLEHRIYSLCGQQFVNLSWPQWNAFTLYPILFQPMPAHLSLLCQFGIAQLIHTAICFEPCHALPGLEGSVNGVLVNFLSTPSFYLCIVTILACTYVCSSCDMGMSDLPEIYARARGLPSCSCTYFRQITSAHVTTNIFHLGDLPASVGNHKNASQVYLYGTMWISIVDNVVIATTRHCREAECT